jgi:hypothetical protein
LFSGFEGGLAAFLLFLFIYQGELGGFMQNFQVFLVKVCQDCVEVRNREGFGILGAIEIMRHLAICQGITRCPTIRQGINSPPHSRSPLKEDW